MKIGIVADTHIPLRAKGLPNRVYEVLEQVGLILHAGDLVSEDVLVELRAIAPVKAVLGNCDPGYLARELPETLFLELEGYKVGLTHGHLGDQRLSTPRRALAQFDQADIVVFGHSHMPYNETIDGTLLFNPGSPTDRRRQPQFSVGLIELGREVSCRHIFF